MPTSDIGGQDVGHRVSAVRQRREPGLDTGPLAREQSVAAIDDQAVRIAHDGVVQAVGADVLGQVVEFVLR
jgi:hypothetical protein